MRETGVRGWGLGAGRKPSSSPLAGEVRWGGAPPAPTLALLFLLLLTGCGFSPIYGNHGGATDTPVAKALNDVQIANIPDREGQFLRNHLIDRLYFNGRPTQPQARLEVALTHYTRDFGILENATASRAEWNQTAQYTLKALDGRTLLTGRAKSAVGYSKLNAQYGALAAEQTAQERALREIGEQIVNRLSLYYAEQAPDMGK